jgi:hypothetical protein
MTFLTTRRPFTLSIGHSTSAKAAGQYFTAPCPRLKRVEQFLSALFRVSFPELLNL